jgi:hypothetical protein
MGNWKARGVGQMIVTVGWEDVTGTSNSGGTRRRGELITSATDCRTAYGERRWCRVYGRRA